MGLSLQEEEKGTQSYDVLYERLNFEKTAFYRYQSGICGENDGLPRIDFGIPYVPGPTSSGGGILLPGFVFLYIAGYIGWAGRRYLLYVRTNHQRWKSVYAKKK